MTSMNSWGSPTGLCRAAMGGEILATYLDVVATTIATNVSWPLPSAPRSAGARRASCNPSVAPRLAGGRRLARFSAGEVKLA